MTEPSDEAALIEKLYEYGGQLNNAKDKSQNVKDYQRIIDAAKTSIKAKQLASQLIPRFFKFFPDLSGPALDAHLDLVEEYQELGVPNATNSLWLQDCYRQPSDRLGVDFSEHYHVFTERLNSIEELTRATVKKLNQVMAVHNKSMAPAKTEEAKEKIKPLKQNTITGLRACKNILTMTKPLHSKAPSFIGDKSIKLSWKEATKTHLLQQRQLEIIEIEQLYVIFHSSCGAKRPAPTNGSNNVALKKGQGSGGLQNQLANRALQGLPSDWRIGGSRGRGRGWVGRGRGRGYR